MTCTPLAWETLTHKTEERGNQGLDALAACCLPQLLGLISQQMTNKLRIKSSQVSGPIPNGKQDVFVKHNVPLYMTLTL
ncbi:hypothetical protein DPMN_076222 [Dreissena polymorpha]|uniref:Uncharacterized protein n=1 Tax=Dreissena polymorpha TaxID=45954 RepID=A0A9D4BM82_DREPO|nr:hypothetical protein DPMN_076222 [Dreissena polymorpha]